MVAVAPSTNRLWKGLSKVKAKYLLVVLELYCGALGAVTMLIFGLLFALIGLIALSPYIIYKLYKYLRKNV